MLPPAPPPCLATADLSWFERLERDIVHWVTCTAHQDTLGVVLLAAQTKVVPVVLVLVVVGAIARANLRLALRVLFTAGVGWALAMLLADALWRWTPRARPQEAYEAVLRSSEELSTCATRPEALALRSAGAGSSSFPSRHGLSVGVFVVALWRARRWAGWLAALYGVVVLFGRVYSGKHWPSDLLAGVVLGTGIAWLCWRAYPPVGRWLRLEPRTGIEG